MLPSWSLLSVEMNIKSVSEILSYVIVKMSLCFTVFTWFLKGMTGAYLVDVLAIFFVLLTMGVSTDKKRKEKET